MSAIQAGEVASAANPVPTDRPDAVSEAEKGRNPPGKVVRTVVCEPAIIDMLKSLKARMLGNSEDRSVWPSPSIMGQATKTKYVTGRQRGYL
jgi:hypothetical protein